MGGPGDGPAIKLLRVGACSVINRTERFFDTKFHWPGVDIQLDDFQWLHGGRKIWVAGTGHVAVQTLEPGQQERRYEFKLSRVEVNQLIQTFIDFDFLNIDMPYRPGLPDEARPTIMVFNSKRWLESRAKWTGDQHEGFDAVYNQLLRLETLTKTMTPVYVGPYQAGYWLRQPNRTLSRWLVGFKQELRLSRLIGPLTRGLLYATLFVLLLVVAYYWVKIDPDHRYGFWAGLLHGYVWPHNLILSWVTGRYVWAPLNTGFGYSVAFILGVVTPHVAGFALKVWYDVWKAGH